MISVSRHIYIIKKGLGQDLSRPSLNALMSSVAANITCSKDKTKIPPKSQIYHVFVVRNEQFFPGSSAGDGASSSMAGPYFLVS